MKLSWWFLQYISGLCSFLSIVIYGARHGDVSGGMKLHVSYTFCALNLGLQMIIFLISVCMLDWLATLVFIGRLTTSGAHTAIVTAPTIITAPQHCLHDHRHGTYNHHWHPVDAHTAIVTAPTIIIEPITDGTCYICDARASVKNIHWIVYCVLNVIFIYLYLYLYLYIICFSFAYLFIMDYFVVLFFTYLLSYVKHTINNIQCTRRVHGIMFTR